MSPQNRTPRQQQGDGLVPLLTRVTPEVLVEVQAEARERDVSVAEVVRLAIHRFFNSDYGL